MISINTHEAKTKLSALLAAVEQKNETVLICRNGKAIAQLVRVSPAADRLTTDPALKVDLHYDPTEPLAADEVPDEYR